jgi:penicillin-binding protein 1A
MKRILKYLLGGMFAVTICGTLAVLAYVYSLSQDLPGYETLADYEPPVTTRVYAGDGTLIGEYARERRLFSPIWAIPPTLKAAFLSAEDKNFYSHPGVDPVSILRATVYNLRNSGRPQGASTITQQVARNFLLSRDVSYERKIREMVLAMRIDAAFEKDDVLELYLNQIFLGDNSYGVTAATINYFGKTLDELTLAESAYLAALPKGPANYHPVRRTAAAIERRNWVLDQMLENGYISSEEMALAKAEELVTYSRPFGAVAPDVDYFVEEVRRFLYDRYGEEQLYDGGLQVRTTLDTKLQEIAVSSLRNGLIAYDRRHGWRGPAAQIDIEGDWRAAFAEIDNKSGVDSWRLALVTGSSEDNEAALIFADGSSGTIPFSELTWARRQINTYVGSQVRNVSDVVEPGDVVYVEPVTGEDAEPGTYILRQIPEVNGAMVAVDPFSGHVLALTGGFSYVSSEFDRAMQADRQVGSTFKPFVYATALDNGYTPVTKILDGPFAVEQGPGLPLWSPQNYEVGSFLGETTLRRGIELSRNVMTARLAHDVGMDKISELVERMGVYDNLEPLLSMSLGAGETTLLRMTTGYAQFVNGGRKLDPTLIVRVQDRRGKTVYRFDERECLGCNSAEWNAQEEPLLNESMPEILDARTAYQITSILEGVIQRGTGASISTLRKPLGGKTGTTSDFRDAWFIGFSPDLAVGVYVGFDEPRPLGQGEAGSRAAAPIFKQFMEEALADEPPTPFRIPQGVVLVPTNPRTGAPMRAGQAGAILEPFKPGTEPGLRSLSSFGDGNFDGEGYAAEITNNPDTLDIQIGSGTGGLY